MWREGPGRLIPRVRPPGGISLGGRRHPHAAPVGGFQAGDAVGLVVHRPTGTAYLVAGSGEGRESRSPRDAGGGVADSLPPENNPKTFQSRSENSVSPLPALMEKGVVGWVMKFVWHGIGMASPPSGPKERRGDRAAGPGEGPRSGPRPAPLLWGNRQ